MKVKILREVFDRFEDLAAAFWASDQNGPTLLTDTTFFCNDGTINAHKFVLQKACPAFFHSEATEQSTLDIIVPECTVEIMKCWLEVIYTGCTGNLTAILTNAIVDVAKLFGFPGIFKIEPFEDMECVEFNQHYYETEAGDDHNETFENTDGSESMFDPLATEFVTGNVEKGIIEQNTLKSVAQEHEPDAQAPEPGRFFRSGSWKWRKSRSLEEKHELANCVRRHKQEYEDELAKWIPKKVYDPKQKIRLRVAKPPAPNFHSKAVRDFYPNLRNAKWNDPIFRRALEMARRCLKADVEDKEPPKKRYRREGGGSKKKAPEVREALFEWFIDVRAVFKKYLPKKLFVAKARDMYQTWINQQPVEVMLKKQACGPCPAYTSGFTL